MDEKKDLLRSEHPSRAPWALATNQECPFGISVDTTSVFPGASTELYWLVDDAAGAHRELSNQGAAPGPIDTKPFGKLFSVKDPEGEPRWILELAAARPSKPV
jgi:hypothetical protein